MKLEVAMTHLRAYEEPRDAHSERELLTLVQRKSEEFDRSIGRRDRRETIAAVLVFVFFSFILPDASWLTRIGAIIVLAGCVSTYAMLRRARTSHASAADQPLTERLRTERAKVDAQIRLLRRVLWWYISPLAVGVVLAFVGAAGVSLTSVIYTIAVVAMSAGIYYMNQIAVRRELIPRRNELDRVLRQVEE